MAGFEVKIVESSRELSPREKVKFKGTTDVIKLDDAVQPDESLVIEPIMYVVLDIHNDKSDNPEYKQYVIVDASGDRYITGSPSLFESFINIWNELDGIESDEVWAIKVFKKPSTNFKGKFFLTCSLV